MWCKLECKCDHDKDGFLSFREIVSGKSKCGDFRSILIPPGQRRCAWIFWVLTWRTSSRCWRWCSSLTSLSPPQLPPAFPRRRPPVSFYLADKWRTWCRYNWRQGCRSRFLSGILEKNMLFIFMVDDNETLLARCSISIPKFLYITRFQKYTYSPFILSP